MKKKLLILLVLLPLSGIGQLNTSHVIHTGRSRLYFGNYTGAIESFNMLVSMQPHLPEPYFYRGVSKMNLEDYRGAISDLNKALEIKPFYPEALMYRGIVNYNLGAYDKAMNDYSEAMQLDGENADIYNNRGICKAAMRDLEGAIADYSRAIELKPKNYNAHLNRSIAYQLLEEWDSAIADCNQLIRIRPNSAMGYMSRGLIKIEQKEFAGALRDFDMAIYLDPRNAHAYLNRGMVKQQLESYDAAIMDYNQAIEINNQMASAYFNRGIAREMTGKDGYQQDYDYASLLDPRFARRPWQTAKEQEEARKQQLQAWQQQASNIAPADSSTNAFIADTSSNEAAAPVIDLAELQKRKMKANLVVEDNRQIPGQEAEDPGRVQNQNIQITLLPLFEIATISRTSADNETVGYFNMLIEKLNASFNYQPYLTLSNQPLSSEAAKAYYQNQVLVFDQRIEQNKGISNNYLYRGIFKSLTGNYNGALSDLDRAIELDEHNLLAYFMRANTRTKLIEAIEKVATGSTLNTSLQSMQKLKPQNKNSLPDEAMDAILTDYSVVLYMNPQFPFGYFNRGNLFIKNEQYLAAMDEYSKAIEIENDFAEAYYNRGLVKVLLNDIEGGARDLSKAGELGIEESYNVIKRYCN
ncbi:tetratricopeptide repeat protein [Roseimarinus sediminis]|uniref:tetratricopeptide repeat protein n=1 Tax=Roseimarinus sediminis TaxID=1610899 RepID=UPI003D25A2B3